MTIQTLKKFHKIVILDTIFFYPEHRKLLNKMAESVLEYPSSLSEGLEKQYDEHPELFLDKKCYTQIATDNIPLQLLMNRVDGADCIISCWTNIPDEILKLNPQLKLIVFWTHEKEHRVNMQLANELGITVSNIPDYGTDSVTEAVFAGMWQLLDRNCGRSDVPTTEQEIMHAVMNETFSRFRLLLQNEKNTRSGKFTHHFHKLGAVKFDFENNQLDKLIPEKLIENKRVGFFQLPHADLAAKTLEIFGVNSLQYWEKDVGANLATLHKFFADMDLVYFDSTNVASISLERIAYLYGHKMIDIQTLKAVNKEFQGVKFGVIGLGRIGTRVAQIAKELGFNTFYYSRERKPKLEQSLGLTYAPLDELLEVCDVVSIHVPAHKAENLLTRERIYRLKSKAILINTADGNVIDQTALTERMTTNEIYVYLDVYPGLPRKDILGLPMTDRTDWKLRDLLPEHVLAYRAGWKTQESIKVKTYKLLGLMADHLLTN